MQQYCQHTELPLVTVIAAAIITSPSLRGIHARQGGGREGEEGGRRGREGGGGREKGREGGASREYQPTLEQGTKSLCAGIINNVVSAQCLFG